MGDFSKFQRAKVYKRLPVVFSRSEVHRLLDNLTGTSWLMASIMYGAGLRIQECISLRVKDIDPHYGTITVHDAKGFKCRVTVFPQRLNEPFKQHLNERKKLFDGICKMKKEERLYQIDCLRSPPMQEQDLHGSIYFRLILSDLIQSAKICAAGIAHHRHYKKNLK